MVTDKYQIVEEDYNNVDSNFHNSYNTIEEYASQVTNFLAELKNGQKLLNIGGTEAECSYFANAGLRVSNIDISKVMLDHIAQSDSRIKLIHANIKNYDRSSYNAVWACRSLIHIPPEDLLLVLKNIYNLLSPNGVFGCIMFTTEDLKPKEELIPEPHAKRKGIKYYRVLYSIDTLVEIFISAGFSITKQHDCADKDGESSVYFELAT